MAGMSPSATNPARRQSPGGELTSAHVGAHIWWLEDDRQLCRLLEGRLTACGWQLTLFHRGQDLLAALQQDQPDLLILDRLIPGTDGMALLQNLRRQSGGFPVLVLSAMGSPEHRIEGLALGANDYLAKPFHSRELIWRIERLLQGRPPALMPRSSREQAVRLGPLTLEPARCCLRDAAGRESPVSRGDIALLRMLLERPGTVRSRAQLARASGSLVDVDRSRSLDVRLSRLRRLLRELSAGAVSIDAVRGEGYRLSLPVPDAALGGPQSLALILILDMAVGLVALQALPAMVSPLLWVLGLSALLILVLRHRRQIQQLRRQQASLMLQASERRAQWQMLLHDQFAPLTRLLLRLEGLHPDQPPDQELIDGLRCDLNLMRELQQQLLAAPNEPMATAERQIVELQELCQQVARHYRRDCLQLSVPRLMLNLDVQMLQRVLHNLIDNALEYGNPPVRILAAIEPQGLLLEVEDRGPAQAGGASDSLGGWPHRGLGLTLAIRFCSRHGGRLELEPQSGRGLLVRLRLAKDCLLQDGDSNTPGQPSGRQP